MWYTSMPVTRTLTGRPMNSAVRPINRSEVVRRIFHQKGNISNSAVLAFMARQGLEISDSCINQQRKKMFADEENLQLAAQ